MVLDGEFVVSGHGDGEVGWKLTDENEYLLDT